MSEQRILFQENAIKLKRKKIFLLKRSNIQLTDSVTEPNNRLQLFPDGELIGAASEARIDRRGSRGRSRRRSRRRHLDSASASVVDAPLAAPLD